MGDGFAVEIMLSFWGQRVKEIIDIAYGIGRIARAHQGFGIRRRSPIEIGATALRQGQGRG